MDTKMSSIIAPGQRLGAIGTPVQSKPEQQNMVTRVLGGGGDAWRFGGGGTRHIGEGRGNRALGDEGELGRKILATHHEAEERIQVRPILQVIDVIFQRAAADLPGLVQVHKTKGHAIAKLTISQSEIGKLIIFFKQNFIELP